MIRESLSIISSPKLTNNISYVLPAPSCAFNTLCTALWVLLLIWHCEYNWMDTIMPISQLKKTKLMEGKGLALGLDAKTKSYLLPIPLSRRFLRNCY